LEQFLLKNAARDGTLVGNQIINNQFGLNGTDLNGRDIFYDGKGNDNCISGNTGVQVTEPTDADTFVPCPFSGANTYNEQSRNTAVGYAVAPDQETARIRHHHAA